MQRIGFNPYASRILKAPQTQPLFGVRAKFDIIVPEFEAQGNAHNADANQFLAGQMSGNARVKIVTNKKDLDTAWKLLNPQGTKPAVDFKNKAVVIVSQASTGGSPSLSRNEINYDSQTKQLTMNLNYPDMSGMMTTCVMGNAWYLAVVDKVKVEKKPTVNISVE